MKIPAYKIEALQDRIAKFNKKAAKWGLPVVGYTVDKIEAEPVKTPEGKVKYYIDWAHITITGDIPKLAGWSVHSRVEPTGVEGMNHVYTAPQFSSVERLRTTAMVCEHCNMQRRRSLVYLLQNADTGEQKLVGKSCIADFIPVANAESLLAYLESFRTIGGSDEENDHSNAPREAQVYPVDLAIAEALVLIGKKGFTSRKAADAYNEKVSASEAETGKAGKYINPTSSDMAREDYYPQRGTPILRSDFYTDEELAAQADNVEKVKAHILAMNADGNDFAYNLQVAVKLTHCKYKFFGFLAAGVNQYLRSIQTAQEQAQERESKANGWLGTVGARETFTGLKLVREHAIQGGYGTTFITGFEDAAGNSVVWFASSRVGNVGEVFTIKATVKAHEDYKGRKQTVITRGKVAPAAEVAA